MTTETTRGCVDCASNIEPLEVRPAEQGSDYCEDHITAREALALTDEEADRG